MILKGFLDQKSKLYHKLEWPKHCSKFNIQNSISLTEHQNANVRLFKEHKFGEFFWEELYGATVAPFSTLNGATLLYESYDVVRVPALALNLPILVPIVSTLPTSDCKLLLLLLWNLKI